MTSEWVDLVDPTEGELTAALLDRVHPTAAARLAAPLERDAEPRPRLETHGDYIFGVLLAPTLGDDCLHLTEIDLVLTADKLVTVQKSGDGHPEVPLQRLQAVADAGGEPPGLCLHRIVDEIAERCLATVDGIDARIDRLEEQVETGAAQNIRAQIADLRRMILDLRRIVLPTRDAARQVLDDRVELGSMELFPRDIEIRFADTYDKLLRATDSLDLARDLLAGVRDYHQAQIALDQNDVMKKLTVIASILLLPTLIVGLYGQNFQNMPELLWRFGYAWSWGLIILTTIGQLVYYRRKGWF